jgi:hypothetical protein
VVQKRRRLAAQGAANLRDGGGASRIRTADLWIMIPFEAVFIGVHL